MGLPDDPAACGVAGKEHHDVPSPGVPISAEQYERLKEAAKTSPKPQSEHSQEDPAQKK